MYRKLVVILLLGWAVSGSLISAGGDETPSFVQANVIQRSCSMVDLKDAPGAEDTPEYRGTIALIMQQLKKRSLSDGDVPLPRQEERDSVNCSKEATASLVMMTARLQRGKSVPLQKIEA